MLWKIQVLHENGNLPAQEMILRQCIMVAMENKILYNGNGNKN